MASTSIPSSSSSSSGLSIPPPSTSLQVSIIDTTFDITNVPSDRFMGPDIAGFEKFSACAYSFLLTHPSPTTGGKPTKLIFDLGPPRDWQVDLPPPIVQAVKSWNANIKIEKYVSEILEEGVESLEGIDGVIWSHAHWDHTGRVSLFGPQTELIVGPGIKEAFGTGWPSCEGAPFLERECQGREVRELSFDDSGLNIGGFPALDFFGDGSLFLLSTPGHAVGHVNALVCTSTGTASQQPPTYMYLGGDSFHHGSQIRPNGHTHLPKSLSLPDAFHFHPSPCPGHIFHPIHHTSKDRYTIPQQYHAHLDSVAAGPGAGANTTPFLTISQDSDGETIAFDINAARQTISNIQAFDADPNILVLVAHDKSMYDVLEFFPNEANEWKEKGWKEQGRWRFLADFDTALEIDTKKE